MVWFLKLLMTVVILAGFAIIAARLVFSLPPLEGRTTSAAIPATPETRLGGAILPLAEAHNEVSGVVPLSHGPDAFAARLLMADAAEQSIDARYYIWQKDPTGILLLDALRRAAERGVRVRLLVDDNGIPGLDPELSALNDLPNFEVRLFNPFTLRSPKFASYLFDFFRLNHRMHNKSFTVDNVVTVVGGRNIGDIYFARGEETHYFDLDVIAVGEAAADVSRDFDLYWASQSSYPMELLVKPAPDGLDRLAAGVADALSQPDTAAYGQRIRKSAYVQGLVDGSLPLDWVEMTLVSDDPAKGLGLVDRDGLMITRLASILGDTTQSLDLISAYFIPGKGLRDYFDTLVKNGVKVRTLTNSMEATDVLLVHAGYAYYRDDIINSGVEVYELMSGRDDTDEKDKFGVLGSSTTSLHAKTFAIDGKRLFVGSFNFDPRSALLNCEMGFLIESPAITKLITDGFDQQIRGAAYHVVQGKDGNLEWIETPPTGPEIIYHTEPRTSFGSRMLVKLVGWLPIQWML